MKLVHSIRIGGDLHAVDDENRIQNTLSIPVTPLVLGEKAFAEFASALHEAVEHFCAANGIASRTPDDEPPLASDLHLSIAK